MSLQPLSDQLVSRIKTYLSLRPPSSRNARSFIKWIRDHKPLSHEESTFVQHQDDFVALSDGQESGWLDGIVEDGLRWCLPAKLMKVVSHLAFSQLLYTTDTLFNFSNSVEIIYIRGAKQKDRRRLSTLVQQTPYRHRRPPRPRPYNRRSINRTFSRPILCHWTECAEDLSYYGIHAALRRGAQCVHEGEEA